MDCRSIAENLTRTSTAAANRQDSLATVWMWVWRYQIPEGNVLAFKAIRDYRYAMTMILNLAPTTAMADATEVQLLVYHPDFNTQKTVLWKGTYGTIKNGTKYDIQKMIHITTSYDIQPAEWLVLEVYSATEICDISSSSIDLGCTRWVPK